MEKISNEVMEMNTLVFNLYNNTNQIFMLPGNTLKVFIYIYTECAKTGKIETGVILTIETLSKELDMSKRAVSNALNNLKDNNFIRVKPSRKYGNTYYLI